MNTTEIMCGACEANMRLSSALLDRIQGRAGRVTCKRCGNKVSLDAKGDELVVIGGGHVLATMAELLESDDTETFSDPHLSEFPADWIDQRVQSVLSSLPPPLPLEAKMRRSMKAARHSGPSLVELASSRTNEEFEAPPPMRAQEDSLSPHSFENEEGLVELGREFNSSPFSSERDESFRSLYPQAVRPTKKPARESAPAPLLSRAPAPPKAGQLSRAPAEYPLALQPGGVAVVLSVDGKLLNKADEKRSSARRESSRRGVLIPWTVAAVSLLALFASASGKLPFSMGRSASAAAPAESTASVEPAVSAEPAAAEMSAFYSAASEEEWVSVVQTDFVVPLREEASEAEESQPQVTQPGEGQAKGTNVGSKSAAPLSDASSEEEPEPPAVQTPFSASAASAALREATAAASGCRRASDPSGMADISVTFAPSGRVTQAAVSGPPFSGTVTGGCIAQTFRKVRVPAFSGEPVTVTRKITIH